MSDTTAHHDPNHDAAEREDDEVNEAVAGIFERMAERLDHGDADHEEHWSDFQYVKLFVFLVVVTAVEVALSYMVDDLGALFLPLLLVLMAMKFFAVVLFFMHLRFDNRLFGLMFYMGLGLAVGVYIAALLTFRIFDA